MLYLYVYLCNIQYKKTEFFLRKKCYIDADGFFLVPNVNVFCTIT